MKKLLFLAGSVLFALASCKKSSSSSVSPSNSISATISGTNESFNTNALAHVTSVTSASVSVYMLTIAGSNGSAGTADQMTINITSPKVITKGTYQLSASDTLTAVPIIGYTQGGGNLFESDLSDEAKCTVTITSISGTNVQGTFSGTLDQYSGDGVKVITNGKFSAAIK